MVHLLFEQSGTFKQEFIKLGFQAADYDINNQFNKTDYVIDLFDEIEKKYRGSQSLFDNFSSDDLLFAFFPCYRFTDNAILLFKCTGNKQRYFDDLRKCEYDLRLIDELHKLYSCFHKLVHICLTYDLRLIIENPYSTQHFLTRYSFLDPSIIDFDRTLRGDYFVKPTQYFFINCSPAFNFVNEALSYNKLDLTVREVRGINRSLISPDYARRFILEYITPGIL